MISEERKRQLEHEAFMAQQQAELWSIFGGIVLVCFFVALGFLAMVLQ